MKSKWLIINILCLAALIFSWLPAKADDPINPTDDTWVDLNNSNANFDGYGLVVDYSNLPSFVITRRAYLRFDLSGISTDVDSTSLLSLSVYNGPAFTPGNLELWSTGDDWNGTCSPGCEGNGNEGTLTWNNAPAPISLLDSRSAGAAGTTIHFTGSSLANYINSQRTANGGDGVASFLIQWNCGSSCSLLDSISLQDRELFGSTGSAPVLIPYGPTAVLVSELSAQAIENRIVIHWETIFEVNLSGFQILRATSEEGEREIITPTLIPPKALGSGVGASYDFVDTEVQAGTTYFYWLEAVQNEGNSLNGPVMATGKFTAYLPLLPYSEDTGFIPRARTNRR